MNQPLQKNSLVVVDTAGDRPVTVISSNYRTFPELYLDVYVHGDNWEQASFAQLFVKARCKKAETIEKADIVVFVGGDDVNPMLYGAKAHEKSRWSAHRDREDLDMYAKCYAAGIPMVGVCRGMQFLAAMNGDVLYQDVDEHYGDHPIYVVNEKRMIDRISSVHHQMVKKSANMEVVAFCGRAKEKWLDPTTCESSGTDVEALFYRETCCFGVQGHPEYSGYDDYAGWFFRALDQYINCNPDLKLIDGVRRIKPDLLKQRENKAISELN